MEKLLKLKMSGVFIIMLAVAFSGCNQIFDDEISSNKEGMGTVVFKITDAPFPANLVEEANVTIDWIKLLKNEIEADEVLETEEELEETPSFILIELEEPLTFNLLELANGLTATLAEMEVPAGVYREIRLHVANAGIVLKDGREFDLKVPSGNTSGLKIKLIPWLEIEEGAYAEVLFDFDVSRSFVMQGNMVNGKGKINGFVFKPVVRAVAHVQTHAGEISGYVTDSDEYPIESATLTLTDDEDTITTAITDEKGFYAMIGILPGSYKLVLEAGDVVKEINVEIEKGKTTVQNFVLIEDEELEVEQVEEEDE
jgi:hypothetical protein